MMTIVAFPIRAEHQEHEAWLKGVLSANGHSTKITIGRITLQKNNCKIVIVVHERLHMIFSKKSVTQTNFPHR